jgi:hypothetical protein
MCLKILLSLYIVMLYKPFWDAYYRILAALLSTKNKGEKLGNFLVIGKKPAWRLKSYHSGGTSNLLADLDKAL